MPKYLAEGRYTSDGAKGLTHEGGSRRRADIAKTVESAGGKLEAVYFAFGDADFYIIFDVPDNISAVALSLAANQSGLSGLYVRGFGQAFKISPDMKNSKHVTGDSIADDMREEHRRQVLGD